MDLTKDNLTGAAFLTMVAGSVLFFGYTRHCPRCGLWFVGKSIEVSRTSTKKRGGLFREGRWVVEDRETVTTRRRLRCRWCGDEWNTVDGFIPEGTLPAVTDDAPLAPEAHRRVARRGVAAIVVALVVLAVVALGRRSGPGGESWPLSSDHVTVATVLVALALAVAVTSAARIAGPRWPPTRRKLVLAGWVLVVPWTFALVSNAWSIAAQRALDRRWAALSATAPDEQLSDYIYAENSLDWTNAFAHGPAITLATRRAPLAAERRAYRRALTERSTTACKAYRSEADGAWLVLEPSPTSARDPELPALRARRDEVDALLASLRRDRGLRLRELAKTTPGAEPEGVAFLAGILDGSASRAAGEAFDRSDDSDRLAVSFAHELLGADVRTAAWLRAVEPRAALVATAELAAIGSGALDHPRLFLVVEPGASTRMPGLEVSCRLDLVSPPDEAERGYPGVEVTVRVRARPLGWSHALPVFRVLPDPAATEPEKLWASLLERVDVEAARRAVAALGLRRP